VAEGERTQEEEEVMKMKRMLAAAAGAAAVALALAACSSGSGSSSSSGSDSGSGDSGKLHTVNVGIVNLALFSPLYVADAKGYFKAEGIKLNLQNVASGQDAIPLASSGKLDAVVAGFSAGMYNAINEGLDVKVVGSMAVAAGDPDNSGTHLVGSSKITSVDDLKGKKIGAAGGPGGAGAYLTAIALKQAGLTLKDVSIVNLANPDMPTALKNGGIDAALLSAPFSFNAIKDGGNSLAVPPKGTSDTGILYGGQFLGSPYAQKFFDALAKGSQALQNGKADDPANLAIISKATGQTVDALKASPFDTWLPNLAPIDDQLDQMQEVWMSSGAINYTKPLKTKDYVDTKFADAVPKS
jgi:NitT/TauT family transport system substrate-binding protein